MSNPEPAVADTLLDEVASAVIFADAADVSGLSALLPGLADAAVAFDAAEDAVAAQLCRDAAAALERDVAAGSADALARFSEAVTRIQAWRLDPRPERAPPTAGATSASPPAAPEPAEAAPDASGNGFDPETIGLIGEFLEEAGEGLATADEILLHLEQDGHDPEHVNALFRVFHTIKGVAGFLALDDVSTFAHTTENLLNLAREGKAQLEGPNLDAVFEATGTMRRMLAEVRRAVEAGDAVHAVQGAGEVRRVLQARIAEASSDAPVAPTPKPDHVATAHVATAHVATAPVAAAPIADVAEPDDDAEDAAPAPTPAAEAAPQSGAPQNGAQQNGPARLRETLKVDLERVDSLMEMIGELIIVESMVVYSPELEQLSSLRVRKHLTQLSKISRDLQDVAMRMRMVPVRNVFQKMQRLVRELSRKTGKRVILALSGEHTEMDRSMVERLEDPLVHMLRNAVDHGIEQPGTRIQNGKPGEATIRLSAYHEGGSVVVEVSDNGRGLDRDAILRRARERGIVREGETLADGEIHGLIFAPGFSTAAAVTEISGRGVGMDVVKRVIEELRGRVMISSTPGQGTTFRLVLPLTLAIIEGMLVACGQERYIVPSLSIVESLRPRAGMITTYRQSEELINVRGELLPLFHLGRLFDIPGALDDPYKALVVVVESMGRKVGLLVDEVIAQQQVVIKPVGEGVGNHETFSGAAILSDGRVGLILNIDRMCNAVGVRAQRAGWGASETHA